MKETMKKITMLFVAAAALLGVTSCNTAAIDEVTLGQTTVTASFADSRTALDGVKTLWSAEDKIEVNGVEFTLTQGAGEATATFASNTPLAAAELYTAKYPAGVSAIPTTQKAVAGSFDPQAALAEASGVSADNLLFEHRHALLKLALAAPASKVEVLGYTLEGALEAEKVYYIAVAAENYEGLTAKVDGVEVRSSYNTVALENGQILNLGTLPNAAAEAVGIRTAADLVAFAAEVAAQIAAEQTPDGGKFKDANGVVNILANIDMKDVAWTPISNFSGTLEGNNHTIDNLVVADATHAAMFKNLSDATIQNLVFGKGCSFTVTNTTATASYAGAVVGQILTGATLKNITNYGAVSSAVLCGGICGAANKMAGDILFESCTNYGSVTFPAIAAPANVMVGGISGTIEIKVELKNCVNNGNLYLCSTSGNKYNQIGGITGGGADIVLSDCSNTGTLNIDTRGANNVYIGGIIGRVYRPVAVSNCVNSGDFNPSSDTESASLYLGGMFGTCQGSASAANYIRGCSNSGSAVINCKNSKDVLCGGIAGWFQFDGCTIEQCSNSGNFDVSSSTNNSCLGGILAYGNVTSKIDASTKVYKCENTGSLTVHKLEKSGSWFHLGGIVAKSSNNDFSIEECVNRGNITISSPYSSSAGGIISECKCDVKNCTNYGTIYSTDAHQGGADAKDLSANAGIVARLVAVQTVSGCKNYGTIIYNGKGFIVENLEKGIVGQGGIIGLMNKGTIDNCENYGTILGNDYDASLGGLSYINAKGSIVGWGARDAAVTIKNCKVGGAIGSCVEADEDFGAAKAAAITAENYADYIYGGDAGKGVTVTDCSFAQSK